MYDEWIKPSLLVYIHILTAPKLSLEISQDFILCLINIGKVHSSVKEEYEEEEERKCDFFSQDFFFLFYTNAEEIDII